MELLFATTNRNKVLSVARVLSRYGIRVIHEPLDIPEIQHPTAAGVAREKARYACQRLERPVMVIDSAFHIPLLNGFPGTNVKWATQQIGLEGYLRLLSPWDTPLLRAGIFEDALAFAEPSADTVKAFNRRVYGHLATEARGDPDHPQAKSPLWRLFIPYRWTKTLAEMNDEELDRHRRETSVERLYDEFARWFVSK